MTGEQVDFGSRLRQERERRQISLSSVAESTKINKSLLASLESGDASQWPRGIYRRAFLREYAAAIGLPSESIISEFRDLFPESGEAAGVRTVPSARGDLRLTLAPERRWPARLRAIHAAAALLDGAAVVSAAVAIAVVLHGSVWTVTAILALIYYSLATASLGASPALSLLNGRFSRRASTSITDHHAAVRSRERLHIVASVPRRDVQSRQSDLAAPPFVENARSAS